MKLWKLFTDGKSAKFGATELISGMEKRCRLADYDFRVERYYPSDDPTIQPIVTAATEMYLKLYPYMEDAILHIVRGYEKITVWNQYELFAICYNNGLVKVHTMGTNAFTREQFKSIFDFVDVLIENELFF